MHFITRFMLLYLTITLTIFVALIVANLSLQGREVAEQDSPNDCRELYLDYPRNQKCTDRWGGCTKSRQQCVRDVQVEMCQFGWERSYVFFGERYCVTAERDAYNAIQIYKLKWPFALLLSMAVIKWWFHFVKRRYLALSEQIKQSIRTPSHQSSAKVGY